MEGQSLDAPFYTLAGVRKLLSNSARHNCLSGYGIRFDMKVESKLRFSNCLDALMAIISNVGKLEVTNTLHLYRRVRLHQNSERSALLFHLR